MIYELKPTPWAFMLGNTFGWITYGILVQDLFVFFGNAPGFLMAFWLNLQAAKMQYETFRSTALKQAIGQELERAEHSMLLVARSGGDQEKSVSDFVMGIAAQTMVAPAPHETLVMANVIVWLAIATLISFAGALSDQTKEFVVGICVNLNLVVFYGAPLSTILTVFKTHSSSTIHVQTMITNTFNGTFWAAYGIAIQDWFIIVPNSLGAGLGVVQIVLCLLFPRKLEATSSAAVLESRDAMDVKTKVEEQQPIEETECTQANRTAS